MRSGLWDIVSAGHRRPGDPVVYSVDINITSSMEADSADEAYDELGEALTVLYDILHPGTEIDINITPR